MSSSSDFFPTDVRPQRTPLRWHRRRPLGWIATAYHGVYEIRPHLKEHHIDGRYQLAWRRGDGFTVRYRRAGEAEDAHVPRLTTWHWLISEAKTLITFHHEELVRANRAPARRRPLRGRRVREARAAARDARSRLNVLLQPGLPLHESEEAR